MKATPTNLAKLIRQLFKLQAAEALRLVKLDGPPLDLTAWVGPMAETLEPLLAQMYRDGMLQASARMAAKLGKRPQVATPSVPALSPFLAVPGASSEVSRLELGNAAVFGKIAKSLAITWYKEPGNSAKIIMVPVGKITGVHDPGYSALASDSWSAKLAEAITRSKRVQALTAVEEGGSYRVIDGKHRFQALRSLGVQMIGLQLVRTRKSASSYEFGPNVSVWLTKSKRGRVVCKSPNADIGFSYDLFNPKVLDAVNQLTLTLCRETLETSTKEANEAVADLRQLLRQGLPQGEANALLARKIRMIFNDPKRAFAIATTESSRAVHGGQMAAAIEAGVERHSWLASSDACERCLELDGKTVDVGKPFWVDPKGGPYSIVLYPPLHVHCFCTTTEEL